MAGPARPNAAMVVNTAMVNRRIRLDKSYDSGILGSMKTYRQTMTPEAQAQLATLDLSRLVANRQIYVSYAGLENYLTMLWDAVAEGKRILRLLSEIELIRPFGSGF